MNDNTTNNNNTVVPGGAFRKASVFGIAIIVILFASLVNISQTSYRLQGTGITSSRGVEPESNDDDDKRVANENNKKSLANDNKSPPTNDNDNKLVDLSTLTADTTSYLKDIKRRDQCSIYLAPSSIKGNVNGFGLYTADEMKKGDEYLVTYDGPSIAVLDAIPSLNVDHDNDELHQYRKEWISLFKNYWWARGLPYQIRLEAISSIDYQPTFGTFPNHHCILSSMIYTFKDINYDDTLVEPGSPGMGAFSYYNGRYPHTNRDLQAGSEIFINYGYCSRENRYRFPKWAKPLPMYEDYQEATYLTQKMFQQFLSKNNNNENNFNELLQTYKNKASNKHVVRMLPSNIMELKQIMNYNNNNETNNHRDDNEDIMIERLTRVTAITTRTSNWVRTNGLCMEKLISQKSFIPNAGRGGFLQISVTKNERIVPAPTLHIINGRELFQIKNNNNDNNNSQQLFLNYCFGHSQSTLLLCPNTNAMLINHCSKRKPQYCGGNDGPNAKVQWASSPISPEWFKKSTDLWLNMSLDEMRKQEGRGIAMEIIALRDIDIGEEVTMDYGIEWEQAWDEHVAKWKPPPNDDYMSATIANLQKDKVLPHYVSNNLRKRIDHQMNLLSACYYQMSRRDYASIYRQQDVAWRNLTDDILLDRYSDDGSNYILSHANHKDRSYWPCSLIWKDGTSSYTVRIYRSHLVEAKPAWVRNKLPRFLTNYPQESIHLFRRPYESDQHIPGAFRHYIGLPDEMMPSQWKDLS